MTVTRANLCLPGKSFTDFRFKSEPRGLLGRFFLKTEQLMLDAGFEPRIVDVAELNRVNEANLHQWLPLIPAFNKLECPPESDTLAVVCYNRDGEAVAVTATRRYDMRNSNLHAETTSLRLYFGSRAEEQSQVHSIELTAPSAPHVSGIVSFIGAAWVRPDSRGNGVLRLLPKFARYFTYSQGRYDHEVLFSSWKDAETKLAQAQALERVERSFVHRVHGEVLYNCAVGYISERYLLETLRNDVELCDQAATVSEVGRRQKELFAATLERRQQAEASG